MMHFSDGSAICNLGSLGKGISAQSGVPLHFVRQVGHGHWREAEGLLDGRLHPGAGGAISEVGRTSQGPPTADRLDLVAQGHLHLRVGRQVDRDPLQHRGRRVSAYVGIWEGMTSIFCLLLLVVPGFFNTSHVKVHRHPDHLKISLVSVKGALGIIRALLDLGLESAWT